MADKCKSEEYYCQQQKQKRLTHWFKPANGKVQHMKGPSKRSSKQETLTLTQVWQPTPQIKPSRSWKHSVKAAGKSNVSALHKLQTKASITPANAHDNTKSVSKCAFKSLSARPPNNTGPTIPITSVQGETVAKIGDLIYRVGPFALMDHVWRVDQIMNREIACVYCIYTFQDEIVHKKELRKDNEIVAVRDETLSWRNVNYGEKLIIELCDLRNYRKCQFKLQEHYDPLKNKLIVGGYNGKTGQVKGGTINVLSKMYEIDIELPNEERLLLPTQWLKVVPEKPGWCKITPQGYNPVVADPGYSKQHILSRHNINQFSD